MTHDQGKGTMNVAIVFDSKTGTTKAAAEAMAGLVREAGHECTVASVQDADPATVSAADAICVGSWCKGIYVVFQHATKETMAFIDRLGDLSGKPAAVFCTYKLAVGGMLSKMAVQLRNRGAAVTGQFKSRGPVPAGGFAAWVESLG
jgi:flavodoxin